LHLGTLVLEVGTQNTVVVTLSAPLKRVG
jgi:hypothetical protein